MNGWPAAALAMPSTGWNFQLPWKSTGRLIPVSQSSVLLKSSANTRVTLTESFGSGVDSSGRLKVTESRAVVR